MVVFTSYNMNQNMNVRNPFKQFFLTDGKG